MKYYAIALTSVTDICWTEEYTREVTAMVEAVGGKYIVRSGDIQQLEGEPHLPHVIVVVEFPSKQVFNTFYHSDAYKPYLEARKKGAKGQFYLVPMVDEAKPSR